MRPVGYTEILYGTLAGMVLCTGGSMAHADYAAEVLALEPLTFWRFNEAELFIHPDNVATNLGTVGALANGAYSDQHAMKGEVGALSGSQDTCARCSNPTGDIYFVGNYVDVPYVADLNPNGPFTVEFWAKPTGVTPTDSAGLCPLFGVDPNANRSGWLFYQTASQWNFRLGNASGYIGSLFGGAVTTNWQHVAGVYDGSAMTLFVNGVAVAGPTLVSGYSPNLAAGLRVGATAFANRGFDGWLDEVALYTNALSAQQLAAHYAAASTNAAGYAAQVLALQPGLYLRLNEAVITNPPAVNSGSLGAAGNGVYRGGLHPTASDFAAPSFPGLEPTNQAVEFDGLNDWLGFGLESVPVPWSAVCWVNRHSSLNHSAALLNDHTSALKLEQWPDTGLVGFTAYGIADYTFNYAVPTETWVCLAFVAETNGTSLYVNGSWQDFNPNLVPLPLARLGLNANASDPPPYGSVDEVATFGRALSEGQIKTLYLTAIGDPNPPGLVNAVPRVWPDALIEETTPFRLSVDAYGAGPLRYQWRHEGVVVGTNTTYAKTSASLQDAGDYDVIVTNAYGAVTSAIVLLTIRPASPPTIDQSPASRSVYGGGTAPFTVLASGTAPLTYQWKQNGADLPGATSSTLTITRVRPEDAGGYSVGITNAAGGGSVSASATLTLLDPAPASYEAAVVTAEPLAFWRLGESNGPTAFDYFGGYDGFYSNVALGLAGYSPSDPDTAAGFDPARQSRVSVTNSAPFDFAGANPLFTLETWARFNELSGPQRFFSNGRRGEYGWAFGIYDAVTLRFTTYGVQDFDQDLPVLLRTNTWYHIAGVAQGGQFYFYLNGQPLGAIAFTGPGWSAQDAPLQLGCNPLVTSQLEPFNGQMDEAAIYGKALTAEQILVHYSAGRYGATTPPIIVQQPVSQTVVAGSSPTLRVQAEGSLPLAFQWQKDRTPIAGATNSTLTLVSAFYTDSGAYSVLVTNFLGNTNSATVSLAVMPPPTFANLTNDLVLHLKFDADYSDASGRTNDAWAVGSPTFLSGKLGQAAEVHTDADAGLYNFVVVSDPWGDFAFTETDSFSVALWLRYSGAFNDLPIIGNARNSTYNPGWVLSERGGQLMWTACGTDTGAVIADPAGGPVLSDGAWHHVAVVFDRSAGLARSYVDGALVNTRNLALLGTLVTGNLLTIGQDPTGAYPVSGTFALDDLGLWRCALSDYEVLSISGAANRSGQSFDVYGPARLLIQPWGGELILVWQAGILESTDEIKPDPRQTVWTPVAGAAAPLQKVTPAGAGKFYRLRL